MAKVLTRHQEKKCHGIIPNNFQELINWKYVGNIYACLSIAVKKYQIVFREAISCHPFVRVLFLRVTKMHRGVMWFFVTLYACTVFFGPVMIYKWGAHSCSNSTIWKAVPLWEARNIWKQTTAIKQQQHQDKAKNITGKLTSFQI